MSSFANQVLLAKKWDEGVDPTGMWMSEKLDGVRAYWDGEDFYSRSGNMFHAPDWFKADLPKEPLDGELWGGRGLFQQAVGIVKTKKRTEEKDKRWAFLTYMVFDAPHLTTAKGTPASFEARQTWIQKNIKPEKETTYAAPVGQRKCKNRAELLKNLQAVLDMGGEGMMLREAGSRYQTGRNSTLLKVKLFHDEEAKVIGWDYGSGKNAQVMGHLRCVLPNGMEFSVGSGFTDAQRRNPPKNDSIITFKYQELSNSGKPRFPTFLRERGDVTWADVVANAKTKVPFSEKKKLKKQLKKQHTILFTTIPSRDSVTGAKQVTENDVYEEEEEEEEVAKGSVVREQCKYGAACYQTNAAHLARFSHPDKPMSAAPPAAKVPCKWGTACFQSNAMHLARFSHDTLVQQDDEPVEPEPKGDEEEEEEEEEQKKPLARRAGSISADEIKRQLAAIEEGAQPMEVDKEEMVTVPLSLLENLQKRVLNLEATAFAGDEFLDEGASPPSKKRSKV